MKNDEGVRFGSLSKDASGELHKGMLNSLKSINEYFDSPRVARENFVQDLKVASTVVNAFARIRQAESGFAQTMLQVAKMVHKDDEKAIRDLFYSQMPQLPAGKKESK